MKKLTAAPALRVVCALGLLAFLLMPSQPVTAQAVPPAESPAPAHQRLPLAFAPNAGQLDPAVRFQLATPGGTLFFTPDALTLALDLRSNPPAQAFVQVHFLGANPTPEIVGGERLPGTLNILRGRDRHAWRTGIPTYAGIVYRQLYPGIDLHYADAAGQLKGSYTVAPGADPAQIRWRYTGATAVRIDPASGDLLVAAPTGERRSALSEQAPLAWQELRGRQVPVAVRYNLAADGSVGFALGDYDPAHPLVIDPLLVYGTYLGGADSDHAVAIAVDQAGNAYVTGSTLSTDFPGVGLPQPVFGGGDCGATRCYDAFVVKLNADGQLVYSTYLGGNGWDEGRGIAVDASGSALVAGATGSRDFPVQNALQPDYRGGGSPLPFGDGFAARLSPDGRTLIYSTYLGGNYGEWISSVASDAAGNAYLAGMTLSEDFPTLNAAQPVFGGGFCYRRDPCSDGFVARLSAEGQLLYSSFSGGDNEDRAESIAVDAAGNAYVAGTTRSLNFPTLGAFQPARVGAPYTEDFFVAAYDPNGRLRYSSYFGGSDSEYQPLISVNAAGTAFVTGLTFSADLPVRNAVQAQYGHGRCGDAACPDVLLAAISPDGATLQFSTYLGGNAGADRVGLMSDGGDHAVVLMATSSTNFPLPLPPNPCGRGRYVGLTVAPDGRMVRSDAFSLGNSGASVSASAYDPGGALYLVGAVGSPDLPTARPFQPGLNGYSDAFVLKVNLRALRGRGFWPPPYDGDYGAPAFRSLWERSDLPVADGRVQRSWLWGPAPLTAGFVERNNESPGGLRMVQYFDKSRMEVNDPNAAPGLWYVTNGLLVEELIVGSMQIGGEIFEPCAPAEEAIAGDPAEVNAAAPTYRSFRNWAYPYNPERAADRRGQVVTTVLARDGSLSDNPDLARYGVRLGVYEPQLGHNIPQVFADFFGQCGAIGANACASVGPVIQDWVYVVGLPLSEPYWVRTKIAGVERDVLVQPFERRVLTYTPDNPPEWRVEMGNVGRHYLRWRYGLE